MITWLSSFDTGQPKLLPLFFVTCSLSFRCRRSAAEAELLAAFGLTSGLSHGHGLVHGAVWANVLLAAVLSFRRVLPLPLAVVFPAC